MWFSFWKSKDRFSLQELRYLTDQLLKIQIVNEVNKDFVIEALRSIAELLTYGDQHDSSFFEFFMEKQVMGEFLRILKISRPVAISVQLLQTISIIVQNLKTEHAIYYMFGTELINYLITYSFDFNNEELLSYYISFLRAISVKLNKNTISLLVKTQDDEVVSFPLYVEAIRFAFHEENMIRIAVRAVTLNVYHVGDESVNRYISSPPHGDYFSNLVTFFQRQCMYLNGLVLDTAGNPGPASTSTILTTVDEIDDNLYYLSDVISAGIPDVGRLITDSILLHLIFPLLLPSLRKNASNEKQMCAVTSLYLLCCILRIVKIKDLANTVCVALFCPLEAFSRDSEVKPNGCMTRHGFTHESRPPGSNNLTDFNAGASGVQLPNSYHSCDNHPGAGTIHKEHRGSCLSLRLASGHKLQKLSWLGGEHWRLLVGSYDLKRKRLTALNRRGMYLKEEDVLLSDIINGDDVQVLGSLSFLATLLQTKELDESMLDALGILPQRKQHKKLLLQALVGEGSGEEQLFSPESSLVKDFSSELDGYVRKLKEYGVLYSFPDVGASPHVHRFQVLDALVSLFCRSSIPAETLWHGGWLLRQLLPYGEAEFNSSHLRLLQDSYKNSASALLKESRGMWPDLVIPVLSDEWSRCKRAIEAPSPRKEPKCILMPTKNSSSEYVIHAESSFASGEQMWELVKVFVLLHQLQMFSLGRALLEQPPILPSAEVPESFRAKASGVDLSGPKPGSEIRLVDALPCRVAFERGKERHFHFLAVSVASSGWVILAEELPLKQHYGVVRVAAPLAGSNPKIDDKHLRWLHLRIRPSILPFMDPAKLGISAKVSTKPLVDGRWTLAFRDEDSCKSALSMILEEINLQSNEVERRLKPLINFEP